MEDHCYTRLYSRFVPFLLFSFIFMTGSAAGASVVFDHPVLGTMPGEEITVNLTLDAAPAGISGFAITISVEDPTIGEITGASLPAWAELSDIAGVPGPRISIMAADMQGAVERDSGEVVLATLTIRGLSPGITDILLSEPIFDDDEGNEIDPALSALSLTVSADGSPIPSATMPDTTTTTIPATTNISTTATTSSRIQTGGSGGGGSGGGSFSSGTIPATASAAGTGVAGTTLPATGEPTPLQTAGIPVTTGTPAGLSTTLPETTMAPRDSQGIPFISVPGILVLGGALVLLGRKMR